MISYLSGQVVLKKDGLLILNVNGVGFEVLVSEPSFDKIPEKDGKLNLFCSLEANERGVKLYGFLSFGELEVFKTIRSIQGIGPKAALEISSFGSLEKIKERIENGEEITGIGPKKASKIILELSGKIKSGGFEKDEAFSALTGLGFPKERIKEALSQVPKNLDVQERVRQGLKLLGR